MCLLLIYTHQSELRIYLQTLPCCVPPCIVYGGGREVNSPSSPCIKSWVRSARKCLCSRRASLSFIHSFIHAINEAVMERLVLAQQEEALTERLGLAQQEELANY